MANYPKMQVCLLMVLLPKLIKPENSPQR